MPEFPIVDLSGTSFGPLDEVIDDDIAEKAAEVRAWWVDHARQTARPIADKAAQYGSNSLAEMGMLFAKANGRTVIEHAEALELGCLVYAYGKVQRWVDAALRGEKPGEDTLHDIEVYAAMAQRIRETGNWP